MKNKFKLLLLTSALAMSVLNCNTNERDDLMHQTNKNTNSNNSAMSRIAASYINVEIGGKRFQLLEDNSVGYYYEEIFQGDIIADNENITIEDNSASTGVIKVINTLTNEAVIISNIVIEENMTVLDIATSKGDVIENIKVYEATATGKLPIPTSPTIRWVKALISALTSEISASDCMASMPKNCTGGKNPYAEHTGGWFNSSCTVGCR